MCMYIIYTFYIYIYISPFICIPFVPLRHAIGLLHYSKLALLAELILQILINSRSMNTYPPSWYRHNKTTGTALKYS